MSVYCDTLEVETHRKGLHEITDGVRSLVRQSGVDAGLCNVFIQHTSASLCIQENADPSARADLEAFLDRLVPPNQAYFQHTSEGPDDMPSHIKSILTEVSLIIPVQRGRLALGTWQGIYLWEHRERPHRRRVVVSVW
ncbi:MAG: secondary thiamine-phosphate synthase enzyme YjbQ [Candidatus Eremiobacterota bacterium]